MSIESFDSPIKAGCPTNANQTSQPVRNASPADIGSLLTQAVSFHRAGLLAEAERLYRQVLEIQPRNFDALHLQGVVHYQRGDHGEAIRSVTAALEVKPQVADGHVSLGNALAALARHEDAIASFDHALALKPDLVPALTARGRVLNEAGRHEEMLTSYDRALALAPDAVEALNGRSVALLALGRPGDALASCDKALALVPYAEAYFNRGNALAALKRFDEAKAAYDRSIALKPEFADAYCNRGAVLRQLDLREQAMPDFERAISLKPEYAVAHNNRGVTLSDLGRMDEAITSYTRALAIDPGYAEACNNRGSALADMDLVEQALDDFDRAISLRADYGDAYCNRAGTLQRLGRIEEAVADFERAAALGPGQNGLQASRLHARLHLCDWSDFDQHCARVRSELVDGADVANPFALVSIPMTAGDLRKCAERYVRQTCPPSPLPLWRGEAYRHDRIRVAYVSADFHEHATTQLMAGLFASHDRSRFETTAISFGPDADGDTRRSLIGSFDRFIDVRGRTDQAIAELVRELEIDIAVDLKGFTRDSRPGVLARRPAPIQVNYLGYPGTMGAPYIDYLLADRFVIPPQAQSGYSEKIVYLPDSYQTNDSRRRIAAEVPSRSQAGLPATGFVFCCFNNNYKITPDLFDVWMRLLQAAEGSVLWLLEGNRSAPPRLQQEAQRRGVSPDRLVFAPKMPIAHHLARHRLADLFLDTYYCNAHTTASDALWAGLPVLTCAGTTFPSRVAGSLLMAVGLPELITFSLAEYEAMANRLAADPALLAELTQRLATNRSTHPLFDTTRIARNIETAYVMMHERHQRGQAPESFSVGSI